MSAERIERLRNEILALRRKLQILIEQRRKPIHRASGDIHLAREIRLTKMDLKFVEAEFNRLTRPPGGDAA